MRISELIKQKLEEGLSPTHLEIINESHLHEGHAGDDGSGQTHFKLIVVSNAFGECSRIQRQRQVNTLINDLFSQGLHAVSMRTYTPQEYQKQ